MPIQDGQYVAPTWNDNNPPPINAEELQAICNTLASIPNQYYTQEKTLSDTTKEEYNESNTANPDDIFQVLVKSILYDKPTNRFTGVDGNLIPIATTDKIPDFYFETGTYQGTGTYGISNQTQITFQKKPYLVIVSGNNSSTSVLPGVFVNGTKKVLVGGTSGTLGFGVNLTWGNNYVKFYSTDQSYLQFNADGTTYTYVALTK